MSEIASEPEARTNPEGTEWSSAMSEIASEPPARTEEIASEPEARTHPSTVADDV
jgi:hypothetical protein